MTIMHSQEYVNELLRELRARGLSVDECLDEMKGKKLGLTRVMLALRDVAGISLAESTRIIESRGDYESFS